MEMFKNTCKAAWNKDRLTWNIGDALVAETDGSLKQLREVHAECVEAGSEIKLKELRILYRTSKAFPPNKRVRKTSWIRHSICDNRNEVIFVNKAFAHLETIEEYRVWWPPRKKFKFVKEMLKNWREDPY